MPSTVLSRLRDMRDSLDQISLLLSGKSRQDLLEERITMAAYERFLEIVSEASRHVPSRLKDLSPETQWRQIADLGNQLRHGYTGVDSKILWDMYASGKLEALRTTVQTLIDSVGDRSEVNQA